MTAADAHRIARYILALVRHGRLASETVDVAMLDNAPDAPH